MPPDQVLSTLSWRYTAIADRLLTAALAYDREVAEPDEPGRGSAR